MTPENLTAQPTLSPRSPSFNSAALDASPVQPRVKCQPRQKPSTGLLRTTARGPARERHAQRTVASGQRGEARRAKDSTVALSAQILKAPVSESPPDRPAPIPNPPRRSPPLRPARAPLLPATSGAARSPPGCLKAETRGRARTTTCINSTG